MRDELAVLQRIAEHRRALPLAAQRLLGHALFDFLAQVDGVKLRCRFEDRLDQHRHLLIFDGFRDGDNPDAAALFEQRFVDDAVLAAAGKAVELVHQNDIKRPRLQLSVGDHLLKRRALGRGTAGEARVDIDVRRIQEQPVIVRIPLQRPALGVRRKLSLIIGRYADVCGRDVWCGVHKKSSVKSGAVRIMGQPL